MDSCVQPYVEGKRVLLVKAGVAVVRVLTAFFQCAQYRLVSSFFLGKKKDAKVQ